MGTQYKQLSFSVMFTVQFQLLLTQINSLVWKLLLNSLQGHVWRRILIMTSSSELAKVTSRYQNSVFGFLKYLMLL